MKTIVRNLFLGCIVLTGCSASLFSASDGIEAKAVRHVTIAEMRALRESVRAKFAAFIERHDGLEVALAESRASERAAQEEVARLSGSSSACEGFFASAQMQKELQGIREISAKGKESVIVKDFECLVNELYSRLSALCLKTSISRHSRQMEVIELYMLRPLVQCKELPPLVERVDYLCKNKERFFARILSLASQLISKEINKEAISEDQAALVLLGLERLTDAMDSGFIERHPFDMGAFSIALVVADSRFLGAYNDIE